MDTEDEFPGYENVLTFGDWDYSWSEVRFYRERTSGRVFYLTDSGCSCYGWNDGSDLKVSDMTEVPNLASAREAFESIGSRTESYEVDGYNLKWFDVIEKFRGLGLR